MKKFGIIAMTTMMILALSACSIKKTTTDAIQVTVSFNAMKEFVEAIGQDKVAITTIIPDGVEPHEYAPKAQDLVNLSSAKIFVYNGLGMESWVDQVSSAANNKNLLMVEASQGIEAIASDEAEQAEHGQYDPHVWLSLKGAAVEAQNIMQALIDVDGSNAAFYQANYAAFKGQLDTLFTTYSEKFAQQSRKSFVTGHAAFAYLCRDFGLQQNSVEDIFAEGEPNAQQLVSLVDYCKQNNVTTIFAEEMASPAVSQALATEIGAKVETIYTIESNEDSKTYLERMTENLNKISDSLS